MSTFPKWWAVPCALVLALASGALRADDAADAAALHRAVAIEQARPPAPRFPRSAFLVDRMIDSVSLSPDGRSVAWLRVQGNQRSVWLQSTAGGTARQLLSRTEARQLYWSRDSRWLLLESPRQLFALAAVGQGGSGIVTALGGGERRELRAVDPLRDAAVVISEQVPAASPASARAWRLLRVDIHGKRSLLHEDADELAGFAFDPRGRLAFLERVEHEDLVIHRVDANGSLHEVLRCQRLQRCNLLPVTAPDGELLLRTDHGGNLLDLARLDALGTLHTLLTDPAGEADLDALLLDPVDGQPLIASWRSSTSAQRGLDTQTQQAVEAIARHFPQRDLDIQVGRGAQAAWLVGERGPTLQAGRWHLYEPSSGRFTPFLDDALVQQRSGKPLQPLPGAALARKIPLSWTASDGMRLHGFLLLPPGADPATLPLVVTPHGGPWNHDRPDYGSFGQFLVNRGYAVFQPQFRGSTGYGRDYVFAARGDFGDGRVQQDIVEGTRHLLAQGIGDAQRVGIAGASFGGYSTLLGVTFQPALFKVGVAIVPPADFGWDLRWVSRSNEALNLSRYIPFEAWLRTLSLDLGDPLTMARLHAQSPLANAARMRRPLLLIAGGEDHRVAIRGVLAYAAQLKLLERDVSLLVDDEAGHTNENPLAKEAMFYLTERLLHRHLGGVAAAPPDAAMREYLKKNLRLSGKDLRGE
ncbi:prolyl oligopeptidase family serine peptidase [Rhodanobacter sp. IGA1.0]|uniref:Prolyl oligopeptidase family serine peptidase n=1 Tax=Rhodanobacter sp. IGA1.0 TaxID=3158582 RepID=A0AAU7QMT5_9GAMM